jgi:hypothetical protein
MATSEWTDYLRAARAVLSLFDKIGTQLSSESERSQLKDHIALAETALKTTEAELAKKLGYRICRCTFPPQVMLWHQARRKDLCARCGNVYPPDFPPTRPPARRGE